MSYRAVALVTIGAIIGTLWTASHGIAASKPIAKRTTLGVPSYPGWTLHRLDDKADASGAAHLYQHQFYSNDAAQDIVIFYEKHLGADASFLEATHTHTINGPDGVMILITAPPDGVPQITDDGEPTGTVWTSLITILRSEAR